MKRIKYALLLIVLLTTLLPIQPVHADMAPPPAPLLTGLQPFEYQNTKVQMVYERVEMEVQTIQKLDSEYPTRRVAVNASFVMHNQGESPESMQSIFPLESLSNCMITDRYISYARYEIDPNSFAITVDGSPVSFHQVTTPHPYKDTHQYCKEMNWVGFDVTFPVNVDVLVTVSYIMNGGGDAMQIFDYVLETGAAWYGPIQRAYIILKLPYVVSNENILLGTTPGYQTLYNEIFWSFQSLEPAAKDNIHIEMVTPSVWQSVLSLRRQLKENPRNPELWLQLTEAYNDISTWHGNNIRNIYYYDLIEPTYQQGIAFNPNNAALHGFYAMFLKNDCCFYLPNGIKDSDLNKILPEVNLALALDPEQYGAHEALNSILYQRPNLTFTPPPTIPRTATPLMSETPTLTPSETSTRLPSSTPVVMEVTVVQTRIVTATPAITNSPSPTPRPSPVATQAKDAASAFGWVLWPLLLLVGFAGGMLVANTMRKKKD